MDVSRGCASCIHCWLYPVLLVKAYERPTRRATLNARGGFACRAPYARTNRYAPTPFNARVWRTCFLPANYAQNLTLRRSTQFLQNTRARTVAARAAAVRAHAAAARRAACDSRHLLPRGFDGRPQRACCPYSGIFCGVRAFWMLLSTSDVLDNLITVTCVAAVDTCRHRFFFACCEPPTTPHLGSLYFIPRRI